jgi:hypothetical protein
MPLVPLSAKLPPYINPNDHAIVVGINHYLAGINSLKGAINDCELFCRWLVEPTMGGLNPANVKLFISAGPPPPEPIRNQIEDILVSFFDLSYQGWAGGRRLYLFFAGHGLTKPPPNQRDCGLVMADARPNLLRGLLGERAANIMRLTGLFREVMLVMDCCAEVSGPAELLCYLPSEGDPALQNRPFLHIHAAEWNATTAEKELPDPLDPAGPKKWQGVLTNTLLRALTTSRDTSGNVTSVSIKNFIESSDVGSPRIEPDPKKPQAPPPMVFGKPLGILVNVAPRNGAARFQVRDGASLEVVHPPRKAPATVTLRPGLWFFDGLDAAGLITSSQSVSVREGGVNVLI